MPAFRPPPVKQRLVLYSAMGGRAVTLHTTHVLSAQAMRASEAGLQALLGVLEERWVQCVEVPSMAVGWAIGWAGGRTGGSQGAVRGTVVGMCGWVGGLQGGLQANEQAASRHCLLDISDVSAASQSCAASASLR